MRKHKQITIQKPILDFSADDKSWYDEHKLKNNVNFFKTEEEERD